jgi:hypothetical protein
MDGKIGDFRPFVIDRMAPFPGRLWHLYDVGCRAVIGPFPSRLSSCGFHSQRISFKCQEAAFQRILSQDISALTLTWRVIGNVSTAEMRL